MRKVRATVRHQICRVWCCRCVAERALDILLVLFGDDVEALQVISDDNVSKVCVCVCVCVTDD